MCTPKRHKSRLMLVWMNLGWNCSAGIREMHTVVASKIGFRKFSKVLFI